MNKKLMLVFVVLATLIIGTVFLFTKDDTVHTTIESDSEKTTSPETVRDEVTNSTNDSDSVFVNNADLKISYRYPREWGRVSEFPATSPKLAQYRIDPHLVLVNVTIQGDNLPYWIQSSFGASEQDALDRSLQTWESERKALGHGGQACQYLQSSEHCEVVTIDSVNGVVRFHEFVGPERSDFIKGYTFYKDDRRYDFILALWSITPDESEISETPGSVGEILALLSDDKLQSAQLRSAVAMFDVFVQSAHFE